MKSLEVSLGQKHIDWYVLSNEGHIMDARKIWKIILSLLLLLVIAYIGMRP